MENFDEWVSMEDNDFCHEVLAAKVEELMDLDILYQIKDVPVEEDDDKAAVKTEDTEPTVPISADAVNDLATRLKAISVELEQFGETPLAISLSVLAMLATNSAANTGSWLQRANLARKGPTGVAGSPISMLL